MARGIQLTNMPFITNSLLLELENFVGAASAIRRVTIREQREEENRVAPIIERRKKGLVDHRPEKKQLAESVWKQYEADKLKREWKTDTEAKHRKGLLMQLVCH